MSEDNDDIVVDEDELADGFAVDEENDDTYKNPEVGEVRPQIHDPKWNDYVMGQFQEDELQNGAPTLDGLRRVTEKLIGEIVESQVDVVQVPTPDNNNRATVAVHLSIGKTDENGEVVAWLRLSDAADVYHGNTDAPYNKHPVATAVSRAEARALRKALRLRKVISAEEQSVAAELEESQTDEFAPAPIGDTQIHLLNQAAKRHNINLVKYINSGEKQYDSIKDVTYSAAAKMIETIHKYKEEPVPTAIKGYDPEWRNTHGK